MPQRHLGNADMIPLINLGTTEMIGQNHTLFSFSLGKEPPAATE